MKIYEVIIKLSYGEEILKLKPKEYQKFINLLAVNKDKHTLIGARSSLLKKELIFNPKDLISIKTDVGSYIPEKKQVLHIYTDGSVKNSIDPNFRGCGWAGIVVYQDRVIRKLTGFTTDVLESIDLELWAICASIQRIKEPSNIIIYSDSLNITNYINTNLRDWQTNGFKNNPLDGLKLSKTAVTNYKYIIKETEFHRSIQFRYVPGHKEDPYNTLADHLAGIQSDMALEKIISRKTKKERTVVNEEDQAPSPADV